MNLSTLRIRLLVGTLFVVAFLGALDHTVVATSLATIAGELGALEQMGWVIVAYTLSSTVLIPLIGRLGDLWGSRRVFLTSLVLFLLGSLVCGFAGDMTSLIGARVIQGAGAAGIQLMSQTLVAHIVAPRKRARYMSIIGAAFPVAIVVGPVLGGIITDTLGWPWVFWINLPLGGAAFVFALFALPAAPRSAERQRVDLPGAVTFGVGMVALVLAVTWLGNGATTIGGVTTVVALVAFALFFVVEHGASHPLIPLGLFRNRRMAVSTGLSAIIGFGLFAITAYLPTFFQMAYRVSATVSGLVPIATVFGMLVTSLLSGWLVGRTGRYRRYAIVGPLISAVGLIVMSMLPTGLPLAVPMLVMWVVGGGTGLFMSLVVAVAQSSVPSSEVGAATAVVNLVRQVGSTVSTAVVGGVIGAGVAERLSSPVATLTPREVAAAPDGVQAAVAGAYSAVMNPVFAWIAAIYVLGFLIALLLPRGPIDEPHGEQRSAAGPSPDPFPLPEEAR